MTPNASSSRARFLPNREAGIIVWNGRFAGLVDVRVAGLERERRAAALRPKPNRSIVIPEPAR
jgi:hypothetical protein